MTIHDIICAVRKQWHLVRVEHIRRQREVASGKKKAVVDPKKKIQQAKESVVQIKLYQRSHVDLIKSMKAIDSSLLVKEVQIKIEEQFTDSVLNGFVKTLFENKELVLQITAQPLLLHLTKSVNQ